VPDAQRDSKFSGDARAAIILLMVVRALGFRRYRLALLLVLIPRFNRP